MDESIEKEFEHQFHNIDYYIRISANLEQLYVEIEEKSTSDMWKNAFPASYIEEITQKTGNYKKFSVFLKMLFQSFSKQSDTVFIDILTLQDLEQLKQKKNQPNRSTSPSNVSKLAMSNKRYLILSYIVEFDKVHYPLPLNFDDNPPIDQLKQTIRKLRAENDQLRNSHLNQSQIQDASYYRSENELLKSKLKKLEEQLYQKHNESQMENVSIYQRQIEDQNKEINFLKGLIESKERELIDLRNQNHRLKNETVNSQDYMETLRRQQEAERGLVETNKRFIELEDEISQLLTENQTMKNTEKKLRARIGQLEQELQSTIQKSNKKSFLKNGASQSPSGRRSTSNQGRKSPYQGRKSPYQIFKKSAEKITPKGIKQRKSSYDSDTESSGIRKSDRPIQSPARQKINSGQKVPRKNLSIRGQSPLANNNFRRSPKMKQSQQKVVQNSAKNSTIQVEVDEEERLLKKLQELRQKNKENVVVMTPSQSSQNLDQKAPNQSSSQLIGMKQQQQTAPQLSQSSYLKKGLQLQSDTSYSEETSNIEERLSKLSSLLKMAKQG